MKKYLILLLCLVMLSPVYAKQKGKGQKHKKLPPGLAKKLERGQSLPPGWQKKLAKGEVLSDELYGHAEPLTKKEKSELPPSPAGTKLLKIENKIIRVMGATRTILDVFEAVK